MNEPIDAKAIQTISLFSELSAKDAQLAINDIELVCLKAGDELFHQGDAGASVFFVVSGQLEVRLAVPGDADRVVSVVGPDSIIGEMSLLLDEPRAATVSALGNAELWQIGRAKFEAAQRANERWANQFLFYMAQILARRLGTMNREIVTMVTQHDTAASSINSSTSLEQIMFANL